VFRLVAVREGDVREVDVERHLRLHHGVGGLERGGEGLDVREPAVARRVHMCEVEDGADPAGAAGDRDHVVEAAEVVHAAHHLDAERHRAVLALEALSKLGELLGDRGDRGLAVSAEEEAGMEHDELGTRGPRDPRGVVEHPDGHSLLLVALEVAHEAGDRRVHGQHDLRLASELPETGGPGVVHPEAALEIDLAGRESALLQDSDRLSGAPAGGHARRAEVESSHGCAS